MGHLTWSGRARCSGRLRRHGTISSGTGYTSSRTWRPPLGHDMGLWAHHVTRTASRILRRGSRLSHHHLTRSTLMRHLHESRRRRSLANHLLPRMHHSGSHVFAGYDPRGSNESSPRIGHHGRSHAHHLRLGRSMTGSSLGRDMLGARRATHPR